MTAPETTSEPASIARRLGANLIDVVFVASAWQLTATLVLVAAGVERPAMTALRWQAFAVAIYEVTLVSTFGQTVGKRWLGMAVVNDGGAAPTLMSSVGRYCVKTLLPVSIVVTVIGGGAASGWPAALLLYTSGLVWSIAAAATRQGLHDRVARTWVLVTKDHRPLSTRLSTPDNQVPIAPVACGPKNKRRYTRPSR